MNTKPSLYATLKAKRATSSRKRNEAQRQWQQAHKEALERYTADRKAAIESGTKLPNMGDYMPSVNW